MNKQQIENLISQKIEGQGNQADISNALPTILRGIMDLATNSFRRIELVYDERVNAIMVQGESEHLTYEQIADYVNDKSNFVTLFTIQGEFLLPQYNDGGALIFTGLNVLSSGTWAHRVAVNTDNDIKEDYYELQRV